MGKVLNQGRVRSASIAPMECDGLLFRSQSEIYLYRAFKALGVAFAPLPTFIQGGGNFRRMEPDFVIYKDRVLMVVEVDGDVFHPERPLEAHDRLTLLVREGAHVERVDARDCDNPAKARECASRLLEVLNKLIARR